jgi:small-conductance mechanosensitive channel
VLSNLLAGIMLLVYRPFHIGDHVKMGEHEGTITTIRMRDTVLRASDGRSIIIPNTKLITEVVVNNSTAQLARDTFAVEIADETKLAHARRIMLDALRGEREHAARVEPQISISHNPASEAGGADAASERLTLESSYWFDPRRTTRDAARERLARATRAALAGAGINASLPRPNPQLPNAPATNKPPAADEDEPGASKDALL